jgi:hypothetical protein
MKRSVQRSEMRSVIYHAKPRSERRPAFYAVEENLPIKSDFLTHSRNISSEHTYNRVLQGYKSLKLAINEGKPAHGYMDDRLRLPLGSLRSTHGQTYGQTSCPQVLTTGTPSFIHIPTRSINGRWICGKRFAFTHIPTASNSVSS